KTFYELGEGKRGLQPIWTILEHTEIPINDRITVTSDGNGSMPQYNEAGVLIGIMKTRILDPICSIKLD
ncbi:MAG TPA: hypothetical protein VMW91_07085, partial [Desulfosporosinus sp.]|nr:hypothetical protein [Desulfosporosinus sp.]